VSGAGQSGSAGDDGPVAVSAQFALYPLGVARLGPSLETALAAVRAAGAAVEVGRMSSLIEGDDAQVFAALRAAFRAIAADAGVVLVATVSNACPRR
jgi:uncharacterized protein YqgV (UPF0045/DUF77 family)